MLQRFRQEVEFVQRSPHPNIVEVFALGELPDGHPFIAMEWLDGETLSSVLQTRGAFDLAASFTVIEELCSAVAAVHAAGIVHRDLKGSNVMVLEGGSRLQVKLLDFGVAKLLDQETKLTGTGLQVGTPGYMAPEQILGQPVGPTTDIYALGILLFQMLTARHPFEGTSAIESDAMHLFTPPPRAGDFATIPHSVSDVIARCLAKRASDRYPSVEEFLEDLRHAINTPHRPDAALRAEETMGTAIFAEVTGQSTDEVEQCRAAARRACEAEGFVIACEEARSLLAVSTLPKEEEAARAVRARALRFALRLVRLGESGSARCSVTVHAAGVVLLLVEGARQLTGGDLFNPAAWAPEVTDGSVVATEPALHGLLDAFAIEPVSTSLQCKPGFVLYKLPQAGSQPV
jgi:serine/threonine-protein kinase